MTKSQYSELIDFLGKKFDAQKRETDQRFTKLEVGFEAMQVTIQTVAEGVLSNGERLDRVETRLDQLEMRFDRLEHRLDSFESVFRADRFDVQRRLKALEN